MRWILCNGYTHAVRWSPLVIPLHSALVLGNICPLSFNQRFVNTPICAKHLISKPSLLVHLIRFHHGPIHRVHDLSSQHLIHNQSFIAASALWCRWFARRLHHRLVRLRYAGSLNFMKQKTIAIWRSECKVAALFRLSKSFPMVSPSTWIVSLTGRHVVIVSILTTMLSPYQNIQEWSCLTNRLRMDSRPPMLMRW